jgi:hypothetical protein
MLKRVDHSYFIGSLIGGSIVALLPGDPRAILAGFALAYLVRSLIAIQARGRIHCYLLLFLFAFANLSFAELPKDELGNTKRPTDPVVRRCLEATFLVEVHHRDSDRRNYASGTIIHVQDGFALGLGCGHVLSETGGQIAPQIITYAVRDDGKVVERERSKGQILRYDTATDLSLLSFRLSKNPPSPVKLTASEYVKPGEHVFAVGCSEVHAPSVYRGKITAVNRYVHDLDVCMNDRPRQGRSGGGLFTSAGELLGVCEAADDDRDEGVYTGAARDWVLHTPGMAKFFGMAQKTEGGRTFYFDPEPGA